MTVTATVTSFPAVTDPRDGTATVTGGAVLGKLMLDQAGMPVLDQAGQGMS